jgi:L-2,4-diaminobutyrate decarboxylase
MQRFWSKGLGRLYDHLCNTARLLYDAIEDRDDFENVHEPESNILCFRYLGSDKGKERESLGPDEKTRIDELNRAVRPLYNRKGSGWITATVLEGRPVLRVTMMNARTGADHVRALLDGIVAQAKELASA